MAQRTHVTVGPPPAAPAPLPATQAEGVANRAAGRPTRLRITLPIALPTRLNLACVERGETLIEAVIALLEREYPAK